MPSTMLSVTLATLAIAGASLPAVEGRQLAAFASGATGECKVPVPFEATFIAPLTCARALCCASQTLPLLPRLSTATLLPDAGGQHRWSTHCASLSTSCLGLWLTFFPLPPPTPRTALATGTGVSDAETNDQTQETDGTGACLRVRACVSLSVSLQVHLCGCFLCECV